MTKRALILFIVVVTLPCFMAKRFRSQRTRELQGDTSVAAKANKSAPTDKECKAIEKEIDYIGGSLRVPGCRKERFCCDSWMNEFNREMKAQTRLNPLLQDRSIKVMLWKWTIRKDKKEGEPKYKPMMLYNGGQIGLDSHYFTIVNYCPGKYRIFDTISKGRGRDVSSDFNKDGAIVSMDKISGPFTFKYADTLDGEANECAYDDCVVDTCRSKWIKLEHLMASDAKSAKGARCFLGITF